MKRARKRGTPGGLDLEREREWAEIILASQDMMQVLRLLAELPQGGTDDPRSIQSTVGIVTAYCRPFTKNSRQRIHGKRWIGAFTAEERALHKRALMLRSTDLAHTVSYAGRVWIQILEIQDGRDGEIQYSPRTAFRGFTRAQFQALAPMVSKIREQIELEKKQLGELVLRARVEAGYRTEFALGEEGPK